MSALLPSDSALGGSPTETPMTIREYVRDDIDKSEWGPGAWQDEPDKIQWVDAATDLDCLMVRNARSGNWCGYVGVAEGHRFFGVEHNACTLPESCGDVWCDHAPQHAVDVHGGLTFSAFCHEDPDPAKGICHVPFEGRPHRVWWLGFDCAHCNDLSPAYEARFRSALEPFTTYRDREYVEDACRRLAAQLVASSSQETPNG